MIVYNDSQTQYKVKWFGRDSSEDTWEYSDKLYCEQQIQAYEQEQMKQLEAVGGNCPASVHSQKSCCHHTQEVQIKKETSVETFGPVLKRRKLRGVEYETHRTVSVYLFNCQHTFSQNIPIRRHCRKKL